MTSEYSHYDDEQEDEEVVGVIIEKISDENYLVMDKSGKIYETHASDMIRVIGFTNDIPGYLKRGL